MKTLKKLTRFQLFLPLVALIVIMIINFIIDPSFFSLEVREGVLYGRVIDIINRSSGLIVLAIGMTLVVASSGGTDISVGAVGALSGAICVMTVGTGEAYQSPYVLALILGMLAGIACGAFNGFMVAGLNIQAMVATLILFTAGRGIAQLVTGSYIQYVKPEAFTYLGNFLPGVPLPTPFFVALIVLAVTLLVTKKTALGTYIQSVGINRKASRLVGLNPKLIIFLTYAFCGLCAAIAGLIAVSRVGSADANNVGLYTELDAILAVAIGGNSLRGGKFSLVGSMIGAITIQSLTTSLLAVQVKSEQIPLFKAIVVIIIVALQAPAVIKWFGSLRNRSSRQDQQVLKEVG